MRRYLLGILALCLLLVACSDDEDTAQTQAAAAEAAAAALPAAAPVPAPVAKPTWVDQEVQVGKGDFISTLLQAQGLSYSQSLQLVEAAKDIHDLEKIRAGDTFTFRRSVPEDEFLGLS